MIMDGLRARLINLFFRPNQNNFGTPADRGIAYEELVFPSADGLLLHGFFMKPSSPPKGTVIHCHGNGGNVTVHYPLSVFLVEAGYNVLVFDYRGYGRSEGSPSPQGIVADAIAAVGTARTRPDVNPARMALFGQSLGGAAASSAMARLPDLRCLILEATFTTYRKMALVTPIGKALFWLLPFTIPDEGPEKDLPGIAPRPVLIVHGDADSRIPVAFAHRLFRKAGEKKALAVLAGLRHLRGGETEPAYRDIITRFLDNNV